MPKTLILCAAALMLSLLTQAQARTGLALDYEHIQSPALGNLGPGSGMGGSVFIHAPFAHNLGLDLSLDLAGGHTTYQYYPYNPSPGSVSHLTSLKRPFFYSAIPVHLVYSHSYRQMRLFAGGGFAFTHLSMDEADFHGWQMGPTCNTISLSFKAGFELFSHIVFSGEFRPASAVVSKTTAYQPERYKIANQLSVKLGYAFGSQRPANHSSKTYSNK
ncbi:hypothetical protein ACQ86N_19960 [Puia sp. P3]|uniref:hypothetical protein n=1 Tax=Puia sp. P3 TaxID=3423952 RepID=UPI003D67A4D3